MMWRPGLMVVVLLTAACPSSQDSDTPARPGDSVEGIAGGSNEPIDRGAPELWGPFDAGVRTLPGQVAIEVWYPAQLPAGFAPARYVATVEQTDLVELESTQRCGRDAPPAEVGGLPVVVYSHGFATMRTDAAYLMEWLASHGYVALAMDHVGTTVADVANLEIDGAAGLRRPLALSALIDVAASLQSDGFLAGRLDLDRIASVGFSLGGYTALALAGASIDGIAVDQICADGDEAICEHFAPGQERHSVRDSRIRATAAIAPWTSLHMTLDGGAGLAVPTLIVGGSLDVVAPWATEQDPLLYGAQVPAYGLLFYHAAHNSFTNLCRIATGDAGVVAQWALVAERWVACEGAANPFRQTQSVVQATVQAFLDVHLRGDAAPRGIFASGEAPADTEWQVR